MTEGSEVRASHDEVEAFVGKLKKFHGSLGEGERAMMGTILESAQGGETGGYGMRGRLRYGDPEEEGNSGQESSSGWNDLVGWIEGQADEDTQGFLGRRFV